MVGLRNHEAGAFVMTEQTSPKVAAIASRGLKSPESLTKAEIRAVCASALTQAPNRSFLQKLKDFVGR